jgi:hypothetical protein
VAVALRRAAEDVALGVAIPAALVLFPETQTFYSVLLLPVFVVAWKRRSQVPGGAPAVAGAISIAAALLSGVNAGRVDFAVLLAILGLACGAAFIAPPIREARA